MNLKTEAGHIDVDIHKRIQCRVCSLHTDANCAILYTAKKKLQQSNNEILYLSLPHAQAYSPMGVNHCGTEGRVPQISWLEGTPMKMSPPIIRRNRLD